MPDLLLDTHVWLWAAAEPERLAEPARAALTDPANRVLVSAISAAEIEIKRALGKLRLEASCVDLARSIDATWLDLTAAHCGELRALPLLHRDPFDRLLIAQARAEQLVIVTADPAVLDYEVASIAA